MLNAELDNILNISSLKEQPLLPDFGKTLAQQCAGTVGSKICFVFLECDTPKDLFQEHFEKR